MAHEKVSLNGVEVYPFNSEKELLDYVDMHPGILVAINAEKILHATDETRVVINRNISYCDGAGVGRYREALSPKALSEIRSLILRKPSLMGILYAGNDNP